MMMKKHYIDSIPVEIMPCGMNIQNIVESKAAFFDKEEREDAFYIANLGDVVEKFKKWKRLLPRVKPFYAVKCNEDLAVLKTLAHLGTGFDCASQAEIRQVLELGVEPGRVVYANPCKPRSHVRYATKNRVSLMTFDNEQELFKIKEIYPEARLLLRILTDDSTAQCQLGLKYGCHPNLAPQLLSTASQLGLDVVGVSFHVGSGCRDASAFAAAVQSARSVFDCGQELGFDFTLLDIGGGFPGQSSAPITFEEVACVLDESLSQHFPASGGVDIIAEPGRYFVASAFTLAVGIISKRMVARDLPTFAVPGSEDLVANTVAPSLGDEPAFMYYCNDGVYGSFNCLMYDHAAVTPTLMPRRQVADTPLYSTSVWGPSCDGLDRIMEHCFLPEMEIGDWLIFEDMGAYTMCAASTFNGFKKPDCYYVVPDRLLKVVPVNTMVSKPLLPSCRPTTVAQAQALLDRKLNGKTCCCSTPLFCEHMEVTS